MKYRVVIHPEAIEDIRRNARWWAKHHSEQQALAWYDNALTSLYTLAEFPESHGVSRENPGLYFALPFSSFGRVTMGVEAVRSYLIALVIVLFDAMVFWSANPIFTMLGISETERSLRITLIVLGLVLATVLQICFIRLLFSGNKKERGNEHRGTGTQKGDT